MMPHRALHTDVPGFLETTVPQRIFCSIAFFAWLFGMYTAHTRIAFARRRIIYYYAAFSVSPPPFLRAQSAGRRLGPA